jgi:ABC-2 type transport system permease protein
LAVGEKEEDMILTIAIKEWKVMLRNTLLVRCVAGFALMFLLASLLGAWNWRRAAGNAAELNKEFTKQWLEQGKKLPHAAAHWGMPFVAAPPALSVYDAGVWPFLGEFSNVRAHEWTRFYAAQAAGATPLERYAEFTPSWIMQYLLPLLAILLSYQMMAAERALGTARNLAAVGVHPFTLLMGKGAAALSVLAVLVLVLIALLGLFLLLAGGFSADVVPALSIHAALAFLFATTFVGLALGFSFVTVNGRTAAAATLACWVVLCFVLPGWITDRARMERLSPSRVELNRVVYADTERGAGEFPSKEERRETTLQTLLTTLGQGKKEDLPLNFPLFFLMEEDEVTGILTDRRVAAPFEVFRMQDEWRRGLASLSPLTAWRVVSPVLSGTDYLDRVQMLEGLERHRRRFIRILNRQHSASLLRKQEAEGEQKLWGSIVPFRAEAASLLANTAAYQRELLILILWWMGAAVFAMGMAFWSTQQENA